MADNKTRKSKRKILKTLRRKLDLATSTGVPHQRLMLKSGALEGNANPAPLVAHAMLLKT